MYLDKINKVVQKQDMIYSVNGSEQNKPSRAKSVPMGNINNDRVTISDEAKSLFIEDKDTTSYDEKISELEKMIEDFKASNQHKENPLSLLTKCIEIASRIIKGDRVPNKDMMFLAEHEPELYSSALLLRKQNDKPKRHDSLLEDEKESGLEVNLDVDVDLAAVENVVDIDVE